MNPDGSYFVTDQEGHWTPKNRINHVTPGRRYYGNFFGYHDTTDPSDDLMEQPVVWITNAVDRSPAQLLWVTSEGWAPLQGCASEFLVRLRQDLRHSPRDGRRRNAGKASCELPIDPFRRELCEVVSIPVIGSCTPAGCLLGPVAKRGLEDFTASAIPASRCTCPSKLETQNDGVAISFSGELDPKTVLDLSRFGVKTWTLKRTASYGSDLDLVYWGTGNGGPWNAMFRPGDNLYICSVLAIRPKTGEIVWHYQWSPNDTYDYDGVNENVLAELDVNGEKRKVLMHADRNGFFYVLDRATGELLARISS